MQLRFNLNDAEGVWSNAPLRRLQIATAATSLGKWAFALALGVYAFREGGIAAIGIAALVQTIPATIAAPFFGLAGDHFPRQRVLAATNALRALILLVIGLAVLEGAPLPVVFVLAALFSTVSTANQPARAALIPVLARSPRELASSMSVMGSIDAFSFLIGAGFGGVILASTSVEFLLALCCAAYTVAVILILEIPVDTRVPTHRRESPVQAVTAGFGAIWGDAHLRLATGMLATLSITDGLTNVLVIVTAIELLDTGTAGIGYLNIAYGIGGLVGGIAVFALLGRAHMTRALMIGSVALGIPLIAVGMHPVEWLGLLAWGAAGFGLVVVKVSSLTLIQRLSGDRVLARVLAVVEMIFVGSIGLGAILAPALVSQVGLQGALVATGAVLPAVAAMRWRGLRQLEIGTPVSQHAYELLRACPVFAPLPLATVENLARRTVPIDFDQDVEIITQGDPGDKFYVIEDGLVEVFQDGQFRRQQGIGDAFGEIALLRGSPRTATVRTVTPTRVLALDREPFLASVTGYADSHAAALDVAEGFLEPVDARA
ncbi:MAG: MFS transporter [Solirubrobacterales bacterium]